MSTQNAKPAFGKPKKQPDYYVQVRVFINSLRDKMTLDAIATLLNRAGYRSPTDKPWDKQKVANIMRNTAI